LNIESITATLDNAKRFLLNSRNGRGVFEGRLSSSALSTATAIFALARDDEDKHRDIIRKGVDWLARNCNSDGGYGDTSISSSNISTTALVWAALSVAPKDGVCEEAEKRAGEWIKENAGGLDGKSLAKAITDSYGGDRTFSVPILTMCAMSGKLGSGKKAWSLVKPLPFEMALAPHSLLKRLRLTVVSYALPALIAIGQARHHNLPSLNPVVKLIRNLARKKTLDLLCSIQPESGGFLEAAPLTSFVVMSLAELGQHDHPVKREGVEFLVNTAREDGSWPIDTNLATWLTTLAINSLAVGDDFIERFSDTEREDLSCWLMAQQNMQIHPYTRSDPGGWAWTDLSGGVPDGDDTPGAIIALCNLGVKNENVDRSVKMGLKWLTNLQNSDGGIPTFCRGWGKLSFDKSSPDLTAHAILAFTRAGAKDGRVVKRGLSYLKKAQTKEGFWIPLWFGNEFRKNLDNPVYGTARVLIALAEHVEAAKTMIDRGAAWLISAQNPNGGWGGGPGAPSSLEETALSVSALSKLGFMEHAIKGANWLIEQTREGTEFRPTPIGLYFAKLWYYEELYPVIFTVAALAQVMKNIE